MENLKSYLSELVEDGAKSGTIRPDDLMQVLSRLVQAEQAVARVRELHPVEKHGVRWHCGECLQDDNTGSWEYVEYPCPTIRALDGER